MPVSAFRLLQQALSNFGIKRSLRQKQKRAAMSNDYHSLFCKK